ADRRAEREAAQAERRSRPKPPAPRPSKPAPRPAPSSSVVPPVPTTSGYYNQNNYGRCGSMWSSCHTGTDFSVSCGTPVLASNSGIVNIRTDQSWSGIWLVEVIGHDGVVTWYAHMQAVHVIDGQGVAAGQQIGSVGTLGNSTGCHLHFEVRPGGGGPIDPVGWFARHGVYI
ncbi:MAG: M23 family metallopeptidase, partial [Thermocrispum sp.]